ncbi:MAG: hypothetical protein HND47_11225 [Chloroflexi bacterium]|nr:hypothetical protein [Chloroflexota bacterium]
MLPILKINLTDGTTEEFIIPKEWECDFFGGASLGARILYPHLTKELDPLSPEAPLLFINGPLTGTNGPTTGRFVICGKSPATGLWAESNIGGFWGPELRKAGYDGLWITGKASSPAYLWVEEGRLEVRDAAGLMGRDVYETQELVKAEVGVKSARVAVIGGGRRTRRFICVHLLRPRARGGAHGHGRGDGREKPQGGCRAWYEKNRSDRTLCRIALRSEPRLETG